MKNKITKVCLAIMSTMGWFSVGWILGEIIRKGFYAWELGLGLVLAIVVAVLPHTSTIEEDE